MIQCIKISAVASCAIGIISFVSTLFVSMFLSATSLCAQQDSIFAEVLEKEAVVLHSGTRLEGEIKELTIDNRRYYIVTQDDGTQLKLDSKMVKSVSRPHQKYGAYLDELETITDTVNDHWKMQIWCRNNRMLKQRQFHLKRIIELDPDFAEARSLLGYKKYDGDNWIHEDHFFSSQGFVKYKGGWRLPQGVAYVESRDRENEQLGAWTKQIKLLRKKFISKDWRGAEADMLAIDDVNAVPALYRIYEKEKHPEFRKLLVESIGEIHCSASHRYLIDIYLNDPDSIIKERALTMLKQDEFDSVVTTRAMHPFMTPSPTTPRSKVLRAGFLLGELGEASDIRPLINGLITVHKVRNPYAQEGNMSVGSNNISGTSFSQGNDEPKVLDIEFENPDVLHALERITNQHFSYNEQLWLEWYKRQHSLSDIDLRRDD